MKSDQIAQRVVQLLEDRIVAPSHRDGITVDMPLLSSGLGLDSIAVLDLVMAMEEEFGVLFDDGDLSAELFRSARSLARAVERKLDTPSGGPPNRVRV